MDVAVILLTLVGLMYFAYRGVSVLILAPILAMAAALLTSDFPFLYALSNVFMPAAANYIKLYFPIFIAGAIFGKLMGASGAARALSRFIIQHLGTKHAILSVVLATALLTYGGVSLFVVVFAMYPIGAATFRAAGIPKRLLPAAITLGAFTFTMTALPGTPQYLNTMPTIPFGTTIYAAPALGLLAGTMMLVLGVLWIKYRAQKAIAAGENYGDHDESDKDLDDSTATPSVLMALVPILMVFVINFVLTNIYFKSPAVIAEYETLDTRINGTWPVIIALAIAIIFMLVSYRRYLFDTNKHVFDGSVGSLLPIFNTASEVGYGAVITALSAFVIIKAGIAAIDIPDLFKVALTSTSLAGIIGSSSGGTGMVLALLGNDFLSTGINPEVLHRVILLAAGGLDTLPHCGAVITLLAVCRLTHRQSYGDIAVVTMAIPLMAAFTVIVVHLSTGLV
ncbi:GntP family permease [Photobacterium sp. 2_MG-2023]|uniref:GntP family permease n=1 Tax=Photobacterium arenosum TaxID=2774143 RepID=A0ABR9BJU2_9GAMM|nr:MULTISPECIES: GntP family permease [Photobacterium]MBD8512829.1 GntP family permease [Photobacterium arenosum]MBV7261083.1 GntP family permease [Photobacterium sp. WH24]MDO6580423.1 GntP family permease [Photobacterium sp. 2_MG-2023]